jgi:hypothetical protein
VRNLLPGLMEFVRKHALTLPALFLMIALLISYWLFYASSIDPAMSMRSILASQMTDAQKALADAKKRQPESPQSMQLRLANAQATLAASSGSFLTVSGANQVIASLYQNAGASGVTITGLQAQNTISMTPTPTQTAVKPSPTPPPAPTQTGTLQPTLKPPPTAPPPPSPTLTPANPFVSEAVVSVTNVRLQAQGTSRHLVDFVSRLKGQLTKGSVINNVSLTGGDGIATLTMDISLYITTIDH